MRTRFYEFGASLVGRCVKSSVIFCTPLPFFSPLFWGGGRGVTNTASLARHQQSPSLPALQRNWCNRNTLREQIAQVKPSYVTDGWVLCSVRHGMTVATAQCHNIHRVSGPKGSPQQAHPSFSTRMLSPTLALRVITTAGFFAAIDVPVRIHPLSCSQIAFCITKENAQTYLSLTFPNLLRHSAYPENLLKH